MDGGVLRTESKSAAEPRSVRRPADRSRLARLVRLRPARPSLKNADSIAQANRFLHWPLEFADVIFEHGGFDVVLGNPPWETMSPDVKEFFAPYDPEVRFMGPEEQKACVEELKRDAEVREAWESYCLHLYLTANFMKNSGRYSLFAKGNLGKGDFNVYRMFVELALGLTRKGGRAGQLVPEISTTVPTPPRLGRTCSRRCGSTRS